MHQSSKTTYAVLAFGALMLAIALLLIGVRPASEPLRAFTPSSPALLFGVWNTRTLAEDNLNGAYSGQIRFSRDYYEVRNDIVATPIRMEGVHYEIDGGTIQLWVAGNAATPTRIDLLSPSRATIRFPSQDRILYMYKQMP